MRIARWALMIAVFVLNSVCSIVLARPAGPAPEASGPGRPVPPGGHSPGP